MREILPGDLLRELIAVEGRYIQWEWEAQTLTNDYITLREATGYTVVQQDKSGRELNIRVSRGSVQRLISERSVYEDEFEARLRLSNLPPNGRGTVAQRREKGILSRNLPFAISRRSYPAAQPAPLTGWEIFPPLGVFACYDCASGNLAMKHRRAP